MEPSPPRERGVGPSPYDTPVSSLTRFGVELVAWIAGPWAAGELTGSAWAPLPTLVVLLGLPSVFNTPGDKNVTGVPTPGPVRIAIEVALLTAAILGAWIVWPTWSAILVSILGAAMVATNMSRYRWLAAGAPLADG